MTRVLMSGPYCPTWRSDAARSMSTVRALAAAIEFTFRPVSLSGYNARTALRTHVFEPLKLCWGMSGRGNQPLNSQAKQPPANWSGM